MFDENMTYTKRAAAWLKSDEPDSTEIQSAYTRMLALIERQPSIGGPDADSCLELLADAFKGKGGDIDELLGEDVAAQGASPVSVDATALALDYGCLYDVSTYPPPELSADEKRNKFLQLKAELTGKPKSVF